jgi:hypothetical protein
MRNFIAFQEFVPREQTNDERCIWCKLCRPRNKSHIISKKITISSHAVAVLRFTVCQKCNSKCGELEQWILRYSPLTWVRFLCYLDSNKNAECITVPSYFYANNLGEWLVYNIVAGGRKAIPSQVLLLRDGSIKMFSQKPKNTHESEAESIVTSLRNTRFRTDIDLKLPANFCPRALLEKGTVVVIARTEEDCRLFLKKLLTQKLDFTSGDRFYPVGSAQNRQHFRWSRVNWLKFCAKISYETLCLFEGPHRCLEPEFEMVRKYVLDSVSKEYRELIFTDHGPLNDADTPTIVKADLTVEQNCPQQLPAILGHIEAGMHNVIIYESDGWVCSSIAIAGFPPCFIVMGGPNAHLADLYQMIYDDEDNHFYFLRLAYDQTRPVIPLQVAGNIKDTIARTYKLKMV